MKQELEYKGIVLDTMVLIFFILLTAVFLFFIANVENLHKLMHKKGLFETILLVCISFFYLFIFTLRRMFEIKKIHKRANTDFLVDVFNRRKGIQLIKKAINEKIDCSLVIFDIDDFKKINDDFGHVFGDAILQELAGLIKAFNRKSDVLIRWGGDEFVILCYHTLAQEAYQLAQRLREKIQNHPFSNGFFITASFGVGALEHDKDLKEQIDTIDKNMYKSKEAGKNRVYM
ncbi:MAG TPA: hypothetical protein CFH79_03625 [Sulfurospirillum sp. UBA11407]|jgi:diguanylate cyclase (GGDEF)-like protein|nr:MAG TPA: hypothetical protein CFH79_03625 [Sulfurospirillum sp. UBA11407]